MSKLRPADVVGGAGGLALLITLFLPWYGVEGRGVVAYGPGSSLTATAGQALSVVDILLALAAVLAVALPVVTATAAGPAKPVALTVLSSVGSIFAALLVLWRLLDSPGDHLGLRYGAWLGLLAALVMLGGCWGAMRDDRTPGTAPPTIPRRPVPPA